ncbi:MAG: hypothetical protein ACI8WT_002962 [Clostridium sp.]|jgi:hypothetical protein
MTIKFGFSVDNYFHNKTNKTNKTNKILRAEGKFITFQYTLLKKEFISEYLKR